MAPVPAGLRAHRRPRRRALPVRRDRLDAIALHEALGGDDDAVLIGHDWGALAAYGAAGHAPERWRRVVAAAVPPPATVAKAFFSYDQLQRSWYMFFFQSPLADMAVAHGRPGLHRPALGRLVARATTPPRTWPT